MPAIAVRPARPAYAVDASLVEAELTGLPASIGPALTAAGIEVVACRESVTDVAPWLKGTPREWPQGDWSNVPGCYLPTQKQVVIATIADGEGRRVPLYLEKHGSRSLAVHETLHGYDYSQRHKFSAAELFRAAWRADHHLLGQNYYTNTKYGAEESFAESGAFVFGRDNSRRTLWPNLAQYWASFDEHPETGAVADADRDDASGSIGFGRRNRDGSLSLFLRAVGENGETGHGMLTIRADDPDHSAIIGRIDAHNRERIGLWLEGGMFDVPPFGQND